MRAISCRGPSARAEGPPNILRLAGRAGNAYTTWRDYAQGNAYPEAARLSRKRRNGALESRLSIELGHQYFERTIRDGRRIRSSGICAPPQDSDARQMLALSYFMTRSMRRLRKRSPILTCYPATLACLRSGHIAANSAMQRVQVRFFDGCVKIRTRRRSIFSWDSHAQNTEEEEALNEFSRALEQIQLPRHYGRGMIHLRQGKMEQAEADFPRNSRHPVDASSEYRLGYVRLRNINSEAMTPHGRIRQNHGCEPYYELGRLFSKKAT